MENAILTTGGKQYRVKTGDTILVELLDAAAGDSRIFDKVLLLEQEHGVQVGAPYLDKVTVHATVMEHLRAPKVRVFKMRRRKKSRRTQGHRQHLSRVRIDSIKIPA